MLKISDYPQLKFLCWNRQHNEISEDDAMSLYANYWRFVNEEKLIEQERKLIDSFIQKRGEIFTDTFALTIENHLRKKKNTNR